ncbi:MAG: hypothetical protein N2315_08820 [Thermanaerothrix sp.]|nr:hypothetical protein [Thermanaerothrix sp.]
MIKYSTRKSLWVLLPIAGLVLWWTFRSLVSVDLIRMLPKSRGLTVAMEDGGAAVEFMRSRGLMGFAPKEIWEMEELFPYMGRCAFTLEDDQVFGIFMADRGNTKALREGTVRGVKLELLSKVPIPIWGFASSEEGLERIKRAYMDPASRMVPARKTKGPNVVIGKLATGERVEVSWSLNLDEGVIGFSAYAPFERFLGDFKQRELMAPEMLGKGSLHGFLALEGPMGGRVLAMFPSLGELLGQPMKARFGEGLEEGKRVMVVLSDQGPDLFLEGRGYALGGEKLAIPEDLKEVPLPREALSLALDMKGLEMASSHLGDRSRRLVELLKPRSLFFRVLSPTRAEGRVLIEP